LEPDRQCGRFYSAGNGKEQGNEELGRDVVFLIGFRSVIEVDIDTWSFSRRTKDMCIVESHDESITAKEREAKEYPSLEDVTAMERAIFDSFVVAGPMMSEGDRKQSVCNVPRRGGQSAKKEFEEGRAKPERKSEEQIVDPARKIR
jgi:hypothetical protein